MGNKYLFLGLMLAISGCRITQISNTSVDRKTSSLPITTGNMVVNLNWAPSMVQSKTVKSTAITYTIFRNNISIGSTTATTFQDKGTIPGGGTYNYTIVATDADGNQSPSSNTTVVTR